MEEGPPIVAVPSKSLQELAIEGQRALEAIVEAAHETLASMNEVLCNAALWSTSSAATAVAPASSSLGAGTQSSGSSLAAVGDPLETAASRIDASKAGGEGSSQQEGGWGALDEARLRLRLSATSLKAVIASVFSSPQVLLRNFPFMIW
ncbi:hypothetical protein GOP47_0006555 [Adiantum capillus-veneris]|uniref:Uncharacterized protein n=1 Tax=Adiantum capillus-veneris TaxID=13818 RepID=A0A9D4V334_ADICA|nr:hypothetical protein GOP47_0006555 [Adiantum capillus-veneris]